MNQPYITVLYYDRVRYKGVLYYRVYLYKLFMNMDYVKVSIGHEILKNMVIVFVAYTPPLAVLFIAALPLPSLQLL